MTLCLKKITQPKTLFFLGVAPILSFSILFSSTLVANDDIILGCAEPISSITLVDEIFYSLFNKRPKWVLFETQEYVEWQRRHSRVFPAERVIDVIKLKPLKDGISYKAAAQRAKAAGVQHVIGGVDEGALAAAILNDLMGFGARDNPVESVDRRYRKSESIKVSGKYAIPTHELKDVAKALAWIREIPQSEIVIKPDAGAFGKNMLYVRTDDPALPQILADYHKREGLFLIQPRIIGPMYFANTYTNGVTKVVSAGAYFQIVYNQNPNYFLDGMLSLTSAEAKEMQEAVSFLMPAHGVRIGMGHPEFIKDLITRRLYLLDMNARVAGAGLPGLDAEVYGISQLHLHLLALFDPQRFWQEFERFPVARKKSGFLMMLSSPGSGVWNGDALAAIRSHPSYFIPGEHYEVLPNTNVTETLTMDKAQGAFYFRGTRNETRAGILAAVNAFRAGSLIDYAHTLDANGMLIPQWCGGAAAEISIKQSHINAQIQQALDAIDWRKF